MVRMPWARSAAYPAGLSSPGEWDRTTALQRVTRSPAARSPPRSWRWAAFPVQVPSEAVTLSRLLEPPAGGAVRLGGGDPERGAEGEEKRCPRRRAGARGAV